ncbi:MAG: STAS domain-containing protein, partial [Verrucomicrobiota bacterium]
MEITFEKAEMILVVTLKGRIDATHQNLMRDAVDLKIKSGEGKYFVFDLAELDYVSSSGFREFFYLGHELTRAEGSMAVFSLQPVVKRIFEIAQFHSAYPVCVTREE